MHKAKLFGEVLYARCEVVLLEREVNVKPGTTPSSIVALRDIEITKGSDEFKSLRIFAREYSGDVRAVKSFCDKILATDNMNVKLRSDLAIFSRSKSHQSIGNKILEAISNHSS